MRSWRIIFFLAGKQVRILLRMPAVLAVIFLPGIVMYTVFTLIFAGPAGVNRPFRVAVVDQDDTAASRRLIDTLSKHNVVVIRTEDEEPNGPPLTVESARYAIRKKGKFRVAVVIPRGFAKAPYVLTGAQHVGLELHYDETQPIEAEAIEGLLQMAAGRGLFESFEKVLDFFSGPTSQPAEGEAAPRTLINITKEGIAIERVQIASKHTFLAGLVPLFLLFSCVGAARGLLEELAGGTISRLLAAPIRPAHVLLGQQVYSFLLAMTQCAIMYGFAWLVFDVSVGNIAGGLFGLTVATCLATTGLAMLMASLCRTSEQLDAIGTTVVLAMSAVGGSMVPRFIMPPFMQRLGLATINGWSYDGFIALIRNEGFGLAALWHAGEVQGIWLPCLVLTLIATGCATTGSVLLARRLRAGPG